MPITTLTGLISDSVFSLPAKDVERSSGLALDIGSSVGKIVYRSNKEYKNGKPINQQDDAHQGTIHYAMFPHTDLTGLISYIKDNCDLVSDDSGELVVKSSGVGGAAFRTQIETGLNCKMKLLPEFDCFYQAFVTVEKTTQAEELLMPLSPESQAVVDAEKEKHKNRYKEIMEMMKDHSQMKFGGFPADHKMLMEEDRPRLLMMAGSGSAIMQMNRDGTFSIMDGIFTAGRFMYGLSSILTGENDFDKLVKMAESSDGKTVDMLLSDLIGDNSMAGPKDNVYEVLAQRKDTEDKRAFPFGKGVTTPIDKMTKGDLAFSVFSTTAKMHAHLIGTSVKLSNAQTVYVCGNMFNSEFMRLQLCKLVAQKSVMLPPDHLQYEIKFLRNGGMYGALGAFLNTE